MRGHHGGRGGGGLRRGRRHAHFNVKSRIDRSISAIAEVCREVTNQQCETVEEEQCQTVPETGKVNLTPIQAKSQLSIESIHSS